ncbi:hypothetical protein CCP1ISM_20059 [Azospirillaceae bacterium]
MLLDDDELEVAELADEAVDTELNDWLETEL